MNADLIKKTEEIGANLGLSKEIIDNLVPGKPSPVIEHLPTGQDPQLTAPGVFTVAYDKDNKPVVNLSYFNKIKLTNEIDVTNELNSFGLNESQLKELTTKNKLEGIHLTSSDNKSNLKIDLKHEEGHFTITKLSSTNDLKQTDLDQFIKQNKFSTKAPVPNDKSHLIAVHNQKNPSEDMDNKLSIDPVVQIGLVLSNMAILIGLKQEPILDNVDKQSLIAALADPKVQEQLALTPEEQQEILDRLNGKKISTSTEVSIENSKSDEITLSSHEQHEIAKQLGIDINKKQITKDESLVKDLDVDGLIVNLYTAIKTGGHIDPTMFPAGLKDAIASRMNAEEPINVKVHPFHNKTYLNHKDKLEEKNISNGIKIEAKTQVSEMKVSKTLEKTQKKSIKRDVSSHNKSRGVGSIG
ncbi:MAG: hypothetical protein ABJF65_00465 [Reichenbachiella sp.]|uniref:hypothetical protein n=1 Tax=Reichenbachiella sp. TaxID=2184521 RepID=UPI0032663D73